ncbi:hypothetical protein [Xenophilus sp.]|jgi:hypothetical protein|uniref:hypothetical protein n=1 Tax=Xenophilus sp. TaxID=1873499 RepID=UPI0037DCFEB0
MRPPLPPTAPRHRPVGVSSSAQRRPTEAAGAAEPWPPLSPLAIGIARRWWRRHPVHAAAQLARPVLGHYARTRPTQLMLGSAALGSALVLLRPWRLLSAGAVLALVRQSSDVADVVNTLLDPRGPFRR